MEALRKRLRSSNDTDESVPKGARFNKNKLLSTWYDMKYGRTLFTLDSNNGIAVHTPVWLLGVCYHRKMRHRLHQAEEAQSMVDLESGVAAFKDDFSSRIWLTYRKNFLEFKTTKMTTDCGWGCMIRSGQMMVANALLQLHLGRSWRKISLTKSVYLAEDVDNEAVHRDIVRLFGDDYDCNLSIHNLMEVSENLYKKGPGDWFGPAATAHILQNSINKSRKHPLLRNLKVYVARDSTVYKSDIYQMCRIRREPPRLSASFDSLINWDEYSIIDPNELLTNPKIMEECNGIQVENESFRRSLSVPSINSASTWTPLLLMIPVKLGAGSKINSTYASCLKSFLATESCVGIIGGKPKHSLYFVGFQDDNLIHLDPHLSQESVDVSLDEFDLETFHSSVPRKLPLTKMDASCCLGFLLETENQFEGWCQLATELAKPAQGHLSEYPLFGIRDGFNELVPASTGSSEVLSRIQQLESIDEAGIDATTMIPAGPNEDEEFVFL